MAGEKLTLKHLKAEIDMLKDKLGQMDDLKERVLHLEKNRTELKKKVTFGDLMKDNNEDLNDLRERVQHLETMAKDVENTTTIDKPDNVKEKGMQARTVKCVKSNGKVSNLLKCNICDSTFRQCCDLEYHIKNSHANYEEYKCGHCNKIFVTRWRLSKHSKMHEGKKSNYCHYFNNCDVCPFEELGCKFLHKLSGKCKFGDLCIKRLCAYQHHLGDEQISEKLTEVDEESIENTDTFDELEELTGTGSFQTSTPKQHQNPCAECQDTSTCVDCFVQHMVGKHKTIRRDLFDMECW